VNDELDSLTGADTDFEESCGEVGADEDSNPEPTD
jgi:hypothetical protein